MRELNTTGFMHNRARMIVATVLCRILHINWREGEKYFSKKLTEHSRSVNEGNWLWIAGLATFSQPYFRVMTEAS